MKTILSVLSLSLLLAACGGGGNNEAANNTPANDPHKDHAHHDGPSHLYSHEGEDIELGSARSGEHTFTATQQGKPNRGGLFVFEVQIEGPAFSLQDLQGEVLDSTGSEVVPIGGFHAMAAKDRYGAHIGLPANAPAGLKLRLRLRRTDPAMSAEFSIKE